MSDNVFDPAHHKIVAIVADGEEKGQHLHVTLAELARDAQSEFHRVDLGPLEERIAAIEHRPASDSDLAKGDIEKQLAELRDKIAAFDRRYIEQEKIIQTLITAADALLQRLQTAEGRLDQHRDVINDHYQQNISVLATLSSTARDKLLKVS